MIRLRNLRLKNFLSHVQTEINFNDETYVVLGENASGKTSILRGIFFGLFGEDLRKSRLEKLINRRSNSGEIELTFIHRGNEYTVLREFSVRRNTATLFKNGKLEATGVNQVKEVVRNSLGLMPEIFKNTVFVPQGEIVGLLKGSPLDRRKVLNRLLGLEEYEKKHEMIKKERKEIEGFKKHLEASIVGVEKEKEEGKKLEKRIEVLNERIGTLSDEVKNEKGEVERIQKELEKLEEKKNVYTQISTELSSVQLNIGKINEKIKKLNEKLKELKEKKGNILKLRDEIRPLKGAEELSEVVQELKLLTKEHENLRKTLDEKSKLLSEKERIKENLPKLEAELNNLIRKEEELIKNKELLVEKFNDLNRLKDEFTKVTSEIEMKKAQLLKLREEIPEVDLSEFEKLRFNFEEKLSKLKDLQEKLNLIRKEKEELSDRVKLLQKGNSKCPVCNGDLTEEKRLNLIEESKNRLIKVSNEEEKLLNEIEKLNGEIKSLEKEVKLKENLIVKKETLESEIREIEKEIEVLSGKIPKFNQDEIKQLEISISDLEKSRLEVLKRKTELSQEIKSLREFIERQPKEQVLQLKKKLNELEGEISKLKQRAKELKEKYEIPVSNGKELSEFLRKLKEKENLLKRLEGEVSSEGDLRKELSELEEELLRLRERESSLRRRLEELSFEEGLYRAFKKSSKELISQFQKKKEELSKLIGEKAGLEESLKRLKRRIEEGERIKENFLKVRQAVNLLSEVERSMHPGEGFLKFVRTMLLPQIAYYCKEFFSIFDFEFGDLYIDENLTVTFGIPGQGTMSLDELSGGQQVAFALALRFAMARNFSQRMELLILDEPTVHLDAQRRMGLTELLTALKTKLPQMLIVTHDPELEVVGDRVIRVRNHGGSSFVEVGS
ncbi:exonuclease SbcC [Balnearium lithotrophicum]|uniref:Exonuclease SbcC n=1 Tax=Balnearium lithotrophicum TaxID=223788 RepID=A0A521AB39_9BACT|nr:AAA family ATPase [Balnearium lithotrophicum]SMO31961.1 exonuclease SbcC [Balnearium lithotrophicum]